MERGLSSPALNKLRAWPGATAPPSASSLPAPSAYPAPALVGPGPGPPPGEARSAGKGGGGSAGLATPFMRARRTVSAPTERSLSASMARQGSRAGGIGLPVQPGRDGRLAQVDETGLPLGGTQAQPPQPVAPYVINADSLGSAAHQPIGMPVSRLPTHSAAPYVIKRRRSGFRSPPAHGYACLQPPQPVAPYIINADALPSTARQRMNVSLVAPLLRV